MLQQLADWLALQGEFDEEWVLAVNPESIESVLPRPGKKAKSALHASSRKALGAFSESAAEKRERSTVTVQASSRPNVNCITTLQELKEAVMSFEGCALKTTATHTVFADGDPDSDLMFIGEAPGAEEDRQGLPFVGPSGQLLNKMIAAIGLARDKVYITNVVHWRPPGNRPPTPEEMAMCLPFLNKHIELVSPKILVLLGATAMKALLRAPTSLSQARGVWHAYAPRQGIAPVPTRVTFHPSYLLRSPGQKSLAWVDFMTIQDALETGDFYG